MKDEGDLSKQIIINIDSQGSMYVLAEDAGERLDGDASRKYIATMLSEDPSIQVVVHTDPQTPTEALVRVIDWLHQNGAAFTGAPMITEL
jgi:biopolymer transport protein ExbD